jgi:hypothetical protein
MAQCTEAASPALNLVTRLMLERMVPGVEFKAGVRRAMSLVRRTRHQPLFLIITTDACGPAIMPVLADLREAACRAGIPTVYALARNELRAACRSLNSVTVVCVMAVGDETAMRLAKASLRMAADNYAAWQRRMEADAAEADCAADCATDMAGLAGNVANSAVFEDVTDELAGLDLATLDLSAAPAVASPLDVLHRLQALCV